MPYAELHCISNFSFLRGASHPAELVARAAALGYRALALTDECSLAGIVKAHVAAREQGIHLLVGAEFRLYDRLFTVADPDDDSDGKTYRDYLNPDSRRRVQGWVEPAAATLAAEQSCQFERTGYFVADRYDHRAEAPVFNRSVTLRDTWNAGG